MRLSKIKISIFSVMSLMAAPHLAAAQSASAPSVPLAGLFACESVAATEAQLACFRTETAKLRSAESAGDIVALEKSDLTELKKEIASEAASEAAKPAVIPKTRSIAIVSAEPAGGNGYLRFTLENGEVWQQIERARLRLAKDAPNVLTIKKASLGSFRGSINDRRPSFRVRQVK